MKKNLASRLRERTETIEFRKIRTGLQNAAQNKRDEFLIISLQPETIIQLQNEGIRVERIVEFGYPKYKLSWWLSVEQKLAQNIRWTVDYGERHISVPQAELTEAENNSFVNELRGLGFHIQSAIA